MAVKKIVTKDVVVPEIGKRWLVIHNLTAEYITIPSDDNDRRGNDITIAPYDVLAVKPQLWTDDINIESTVESGKIEVYFSDKKPRPIPERPSAARLNEHNLDSTVQQIVLGKPELAMQLIGSIKVFLDRAGQPVDVVWMKSQMLRVLEAARLWLITWGPPANFADRVTAIDRRIAEIKQMA
jgi:hypothetical protein